MLVLSWLVVSRPCLVGPLWLEVVMYVMYDKIVIQWHIPMVGFHSHLLLLFSILILSEAIVKSYRSVKGTIENNWIRKVNANNKLASILKYLKSLSGKNTWGNSGQRFSWAITDARRASSCMSYKFQTLFQLPIQGRTQNVDFQQHAQQHHSQFQSSWDA